uniref:Uncharacterized protein n=1 Tax=Malurus cyaneus samueli TaxID=2593467 RepID=A0A8C5UGM2_9PASS
RVSPLPCVPSHPLSPWAPCRLRGLQGCGFSSPCSCRPVRSPTNARGKAAPGSSPARTSSPDTSASTRASNPSAARTVTAASPAPTTWPCTAGGTS